jgi:hypothetical protein
MNIEDNNSGRNRRWNKVEPKGKECLTTLQI